MINDLADDHQEWIRYLFQTQSQIVTREIPLSRTAGWVYATKPTFTASPTLPFPTHPFYITLPLTLCLQKIKQGATYLDGQNLLKLVLLQFSVWKIAQLAVVLPGEEKAKGRWSCLSNCKIPTQFVILSAKQNTKPTKLVRNGQENYIHQSIYS